MEARSWPKFSVFGGNVISKSKTPFTIWCTRGHNNLCKRDNNFSRYSLCDLPKISYEIFWLSAALSIKEPEFHITNHDAIQKLMWEKKICIRFLPHWKDLITVIAWIASVQRKMQHISSSGAVGVRKRKTIAEKIRVSRFWPMPWLYYHPSSFSLNLLYYSWAPP